MLLSRVTTSKTKLRPVLTRRGFDGGGLVGVIIIVCVFSKKNLESNLNPGQADKFVLEWRYPAQRAHA